MYCKHCGEKIKGNHEFCSKCGNRIMSTPESICGEVSKSELNKVSSYTNDNKNNKKKVNGALIGCFVFLVLIIGAVVVFYDTVLIADIIDNVTQVINSEEVSVKEGKLGAADNSDSANIQHGEAISMEEDTTRINISKYKEALSSVPLLTFTLSFNDIEMSSDANDWYDFLYGEGYYDTGSVDDYYMECSKGMFTFTPANESWGTKNDGIIDIKMDMKHPSFNFTRSKDDYYSEGFEFYEKVLRKADDYVDFSKYDKDKDGFIIPEELTIMFVFSGYEIYEEFDNDISTYSCLLIYDEYLEIDGIQIDECIYTAEKDPYNEGDNQLVGIGTVCHELGHALDLPDLYDTDYSSQGLGFHCLMSGGNENYSGYEPYGSSPAPLTAWEMFFLNFEKPELIQNDGTYNAYARSTDQYNILKIDDGDGYYLIENVDFKGFGEGLGVYLKKPGIAIWYVNRTVANNSKRFTDNTVNDNEGKYAVTLIEANDTNHLFQEDFDCQEVYDHYHYLKGDNIFESDSGIIIEILDNPADEMRVKITLP